MQFDELIALDMSSAKNFVPQSALEEIEKKLNEFLIPIGYIRANVVFDYVCANFWEYTHGRFRGTLPKRIAQFMKFQNRANVPEELLSKIGSIASQAMVRNTKVYIDFTKYFDWDRGEFGDNGSCFWSDRSFARETIIPSLGGFAIRSFKRWDGSNKYGSRYEDDDGDYFGYGRAWVLPRKEGRYLVFNGYRETDMMFANYLAAYLGYEHIKEINVPTSTDTLFINGDTGFMVSKEEFGPTETVIDYFFDEDPAHNNQDDDDDYYDEEENEDEN